MSSGTSTDATAGVNLQTTSGTREQSQNMPKLLKQSKLGNFGKMKDALDEGADVNQTDEEGRTPLHILSAKKYANFHACLKLLLDHGANVNARTSMGDTPLHAAVSKDAGNIKFVNELLLHGADANAENTEGSTPLHWAVTNGFADCTSALVVQADVNKRTAHGSTPLHCGVRVFSGHPECVKILLDHGADPNSIDDKGITPLQYARANFQEKGFTEFSECIKELIKGGAEICAEDGSEGSLLHEATILQDSKYVSILLHRGVDPNMSRRSDARTALHIAAGLGSLECLRVLLSCQAEPNVRDSDGRTPLHLAVSAGRTECVSALLDHGAFLNVGDNKNVTPFELARMLKFINCIIILLNRMTKSELKPSTLNCLLHEAVSLGESTYALAILKKGAKVDERDLGGWTPLHNAARAKSTSCVKLLLDHGANPMKTAKSGKIPAMKYIALYTPNALKEIFDENITLSGPSKEPENEELQMNFRNLVCVQEPSLGTKVHRESLLLLYLIQGGHSWLLKHPLCEAFLYLKWKRVRRFFWSYILLYAAFVLLLTPYCFGIQTNIFRYVLIPFLPIILLKEAVQILETFKKGIPEIMRYLVDLENWLQWICILSCGLLLLVPPPGRLEASWGSHVAGICLLVSWSELTLLIGRFPSLEIYMHMFTTVLGNFVRFLLTYGCLLWAFGLSFYFFYPAREEFGTLWEATMSTLVMMSGEYGYIGGMFYTDNPETESKYKGTARILFFVFWLTSIIVMNLLTGLAVDDIHELRKRAKLGGLIRQATFLANIEDFLGNERFGERFSIISTWLSRRILITDPAKENDMNVYPPILGNPDIISKNQYMRMDVSSTESNAGGQPTVGRTISSGVRSLGRTVSGKIPLGLNESGYNLILLPYNSSKSTKILPQELVDAACEVALEHRIQSTADQADSTQVVNSDMPANKDGILKSITDQLWEIQNSIVEIQRRIQDHYHPSMNQSEPNVSSVAESYS